MIRCSICSNPLDEKYNVCPYCGKRQNEDMNTSGENDNITNATPIQDKHGMGLFKEQLVEEYKEELEDIASKLFDEVKFKEYKNPKGYYGVGSYSELIQNIYEFVGIYTDDRIYWNYPVKDKNGNIIERSKIHGFVIRMASDLFGENKDWILNYNIKTKTIRVCEDVEAENNGEWINKILSNGKTLQPRKVPTTADAEKMIPNKNNSDQFVISGLGSRLNGTTLYNVLSTNGIPAISTDPMKKIYGDISFACKISGGKINHPGLQHLHAYVLLDRGIVFANDMGLFAWSSETGQRIEYSGDNDELKKIVSLKEIQPGKVELQIYKSKSLIGQYRNRDTNGHLDVEDADEYKVELESIVFTPNI